MKPMSSSPIIFSAAVEGPSDEAVLRQQANSLQRLRRRLADLVTSASALGIENDSR
jgi:hypothetical protein